MRVVAVWMVGVACWAGCSAAEPTISPGASGDADDVADAGDQTDSSDDDDDARGEHDRSDAGDSSQHKADSGTSSGSARPPASKERCDTGIDEDQDGLVDEDCPCNPGATQACYFGPKESAGGLCPAGRQACSSGEFPAWGPCESTGIAFPKDACECYPEICGNAKDDNCNDQVDEGCAVDVPVNIDGDCVTAECPAWAPYPVGCDLVMEGGDSRGCVASTPSSPSVYFKEGDACPILGGVLGGDSGHISGKLLCSSQQGKALNAENCALNKQDKLYPSSASGCP
ncbi:MAG: hypothetical protein QM778_34810 [Myxococcales bacterium]